MSASRASGRGGYSHQAVAAAMALEKVLAEAARRASKLRDVLAQDPGIAPHPQYVIFDADNPRGAPASRREVARLRRNYRRFCILLDYPRSRCYSRSHRTWITLAPWQRDLLKYLIVNAGVTVSAKHICQVVRASTLKENELAAKKVHLLRTTLGLPGAGKQWPVIRTVSGEGYEFSGDESYCLVDHGGMFAPSGRDDHSTEETTPGT